MKKKILGLLILLFIYIIAYLFGFFSFILIPNSINIILKLFIADVVATVVVWIFGIVLKTASIYDPYWSVQTPVIYLTLLIYYGNYNLGNILFFILIMLWAIRLTINFIVTFGDISYIDWRYKDIKDKTKGLYQIANLLGIHMMPTILVFVASIPAFLYLINGYDFILLNIIGYLIIILGVFFEFVSDINMHIYKKNRTSRSEIINVGFWKYSRHPNYLGEILFWYGVLAIFLVNDFSYWYVIFGAIAINLLFLFISIPLEEKKLITYKDGYLEYKKNARMLIPLPFKLLK